MTAAGTMPLLDTVLKAVADIRLKYQPSTIQVGRYDNCHAIEVNCETQPVCEEHYLYRLRKTAATNWLRSGFDLISLMFPVRAFLFSGTSDNRIHRRDLRGMRVSLSRKSLHGK
jgi:hypothetical protein